jgi:hypothetical protein
MGHSKSNQTAHIFVGSWSKPTNITLHLSDLGTTKIIQIYSPVLMILKRPMNEYIQRIFVGDVAKSMNIWGQSKSYIRRFSAQTDEYNLTFVGFRTDEYNSNIFVSTDEFKNTDE